MADAGVNTVQLHEWVDRMRAGDLAARDELLRAVCRRLERLAHKMLRNFPGVQRWAQTDDVLQNALLRLLRALEQVRPRSVRDFVGLAALQLRRELTDLARRFQGPEGLAALHQSGGAGAEPADPRQAADVAAELERWCLFHQEVDRLPPEEREVVCLIYYHGWQQQAVAELLGLSTRTVKRRWQAALVRLKAVLQRREP